MPDCCCFRECARRVRKVLHAAVGDHDALGNGLFRRSQQTLVEPNRVSAGHLVETVSNFSRVETTAQHLRRQQAHAAADWAGGKHFLNHLAIVIDGDVKILAVKRNLPGGAAQFARTLDAYGAVELSLRLLTIVCSRLYAARSSHSPVSVDLREQYFRPSAPTQEQ